MAVSRIYFDSSILIGNSWPVPSGTLARVFDVAGVVKGVQLFIPSLVEDECEQEFGRRFGELRKQVTQKIEALAEHTDLFEPPAFKFPEKKEALERYRAIVDHLKKETGLATSPLTTLTAKQLLDMAVAHKNPFPDRDSGFRDATIMLSIVEHVESAGTPIEALLLTRDAFFRRQVLASGSVIEVSNDLDQIYEQLLDMIVDNRIKVWREDTARAKAALEKDGEQIERFVTETLEVPVGGGLLGPKVKEVVSLRLVGIEGVATPKPFKRGDDVVERISFTVNVVLREKVEFSDWPVFADPRIKVGARSAEPESPLRSLASFSNFGQTRQDEIDVEKKVFVEAEARIVKNEYVGFNYLSARLDQGLSPAMRGLLESTESK